MDALSEVTRMAEKGITMDVMTLVLRSEFTDSEIAGAYDTMAQDWDTQLERGIPYFVRRPL